jgi:hypothetical protein
LAAISLAAASAHADPGEIHAFSSSGTLNGLRYELIDLDPADGIAPSATVTLTSSYSSSEMITDATPTNIGSNSDTPFGASYAPVMLDGARSTFAASSWDKGALSMIAQCVSRTIGDRFDEADKASCESSATTIGMRITLTPNTEIRFTGKYLVRAIADRWNTAKATQSAGSEVAFVYGPLGTTTPETVSVAAVAYANPQLGKGWSRREGPFKATITNASPNWGQYQAAVTAKAMGGLRPTMAEKKAP